MRSVGDEDAIVGLGRAVAEKLEPGVDYLVGPGSTAKSALRVMGLPFGLLGVDLVRDRRVVGSDMTEAGILERILGPTRMIVSPIGGQGYIFGRGNQQLSPAVIRRIGEDGLIVVATPNKLATLGGRPLRVDTVTGARPRPGRVRPDRHRPWSRDDLPGRRLTGPHDQHRAVRVRNDVVRHQSRHEPAKTAAPV